jgi:hypothetical protein
MVCELLLGNTWLTSHHFIIIVGRTDHLDVHLKSD